MPRVMKRYAIVRSARSRSEAEAYLPGNYSVIFETVEPDRSGPNGYAPVFVIAGEDGAGWTLDGYVIPRYASGLIGCEEIDPSRSCVVCGADIVGNDPHAPGCSSYREPLTEAEQASLLRSLERGDS